MSDLVVGRGEIIKTVDRVNGGWRPRRGKSGKRSVFGLTIKMFNYSSLLSIVYVAKLYMIRFLVKDN